MSNILETIAVGLGLLYLVLAIREQRSAWLAGGLASAIFLFIFWQAGIQMQALLQVYYVGIAALAWVRWGAPESAAGVAINRGGLGHHLSTVALWSALSIGTVVLRDAMEDTQAWLDASTSWGGVLATWMVAQKKLDAWVYWIIIDAATALLYLDAGLLASAALYLLYTALAALAFKQWHATYQRRNTGTLDSQRTSAG